ncbi:plant UBX domain-containing protein 2 [Mangifera indica]|uniref:plant UBX domain-containing protein 2 n=1 Tax=Mangifera indica TaxID=29780 RepID=UPI001CF9C0AD|nr:plant UBX domain-containing protein 2 [Mangifera indica]
MDDMKDKMKGFMKKVNNQLSSSSSGKFKGQGRVLGSGSSSSGGPVYSNSARPNPHYLNTNPNPTPNTQPKPKPKPQPNPSSSVSQKSVVSEESNKYGFVNNPEQGRKPSTGFDPYGSLITSGKRSQHGYSLNLFECPICGQAFRTEEDVSLHVESCVNNSNLHTNNENNSSSIGEKNNNCGVDDVLNESRSQLEIIVGVFLSGKPKEGSVEVVCKLLGNVVKEPENAKFRRIRMSNPKISEAVGEVAGAVELLEFVGFELKEEEGEMWAVMEVPNEKRIGLISKVVELLLDPKKVEAPLKVEKLKEVEAKDETKDGTEQIKVDRQIRVFFSVPESVAARIELPDSFYNLSVSELKREANTRKKKIEESQLLIPRSYREKQAKAAKKKYRRTIIRVQFPDGVVLQGVFGPWEQTTALYEFVSSALKEPSLEFELLHPVLIKRRVIPSAGQKPTTLEEEDLVPSALIKFKPTETDSVVFIGLCNELLEIIEPLE